MPRSRDRPGAPHSGNWNVRGGSRYSRGMTFAFVLSATLAAGQAVAADTVVTVAVRDVYDLVFGLAAGTFVLLLLVLIATLLGILFQVRGAIRSLDRARTDFFRDEAVENLRKTTGHVESMASSLRGETERMSSSIAKVSDQVTLASRRMEERIEEFNALMEVVQEEAEEVFLDTASSARGMRRGLGELTDLARKRRDVRISHRRQGSGPALDYPDPAGDGATPPLFPPDPGSTDPTTPDPSPPPTPSSPSSQES